MIQVLMLPKLESLVRTTVAVVPGQKSRAISSIAT
jgi:hypothetical protein